MFCRTSPASVSVGNKNVPAKFLKPLASFEISWLLVLKFILNLPWSLSLIVFIYFQELSDEVCKDNAMQKQPREVLCKKRPQPATFIKKRLWHRCFPVNFAKFLRTLFGRTSGNGCILQFSEQLSFSQQRWFTFIFRVNLFFFDENFRGLI